MIVMSRGLSEDSRKKVQTASRSKTPKFHRNC